MSVMDELRRMLDERGVEWWTMHDAENGYHEDRDTVFVANGRKYVAHEWGDGLTVYDLAPEQAIVAALGKDTCRYDPDETGFMWWDEADAEHYEEESASDECMSASCSECGYTMMVGDEGWFDGWDNIVVWWDEDGSEHHGYLLTPRFRYCPNCGRRVKSEFSPSLTE